MASDVWLGLTESERALLREALVHYADNERAEADEVTAMLRKIECAKSRPCVTMRVKGGFVKEIADNPFPVRLYDYDIDAWTSRISTSTAAPASSANSSQKLPDPIATARLLPICSFQNTI